MPGEKILRIDPGDNVAVALGELKKGEIVAAGNQELLLLADIPAGHKVAVHSIPPGGEVVKYGHSIGTATVNISPGDWVHTHNVKTMLQGIVEYVYPPYPLQPVRENIFDWTFEGYLREDGRAGTRNEIWIINTVGCCNKVAEELSRRASRLFKDRKIDGIYNFSHPYGCSQLGDDQLNTQKILAGLVRHPNAGGVLVLGLGCENNNIKEFKKVLGPCNSLRVKFLNTQDVSDEIATGLDLIGELVDHAEKQVRTPQPLAKIVLGLKCGGSDAFSGITANPLVGRVSDMVTAAGGTSVLTEVPEMFGAETVLMNRAADRKVFDDIVKLINEFKEYYIRNGQSIYENPSPGNKSGGITTLEEKSLGCIQKGGTGAVTDVLVYGDRVTVPGLNLLSGPGNDMVAVTALAAAGAQLILFTTGRGTPLGGPVPTIKISTNTELFRRKANWTDYDAGQLLSGVSIEQLADWLLNFVQQVASGKSTSNERNNYREIAIFKNGVTL